jgi:hypothetical protein
MRRDRGFSKKIWLLLGVLVFGLVVLFVTSPDSVNSTLFDNDREICVSVIAKGTDNHDLRKIPLLKNFLPSFKKTISNNVKYRITIGYDESKFLAIVCSLINLDNPYYRNNMNEILITARSELNGQSNVELDV